MLLAATRTDGMYSGSSRRRAVCGFAALLAALIVLALAAVAGAVWTAPATLSQAGQDAAEPDVAVDATGDAVFAWERSDGTDIRIQARARSAAGVLSPIQTLSQAGQDATEPDVAIDADGDAVIAWERSDGTNIRTQARARSAAGVLSPIQTLSQPGTDSSRVRAAVDADGDAVFAWQTASGLVQGRARSAAGVLSGVQNLSPVADFSFSPDLAIDADGDAVFTWVRFSTSDFTQRVQARARSAAGVLSATQTLSAPNAQRPHVDVTPSPHDAVIVWQRTIGANQRIEARTRSAAGVLGATQTLSAAGQDAIAPEVGVDSTGDAVFAWERSDGTNLRIQGRGRSAAGVLSAVQTVSAAGQDAADVELGVDADGDAVFVWERSDGTNARVQSRVRSAAGVLSAIDTLSAAGQDAGEPRVVLSPAGAAVAAWERSDGANVRIQGAAGP